MLAVQLPDKVRLLLPLIIGCSYEPLYQDSPLPRIHTRLARELGCPG